MRIHLARHGQITFDSAKATWNPPLSALGCLQAACLGRRLAEEGFGGVVFHSPYERTRDTARIIAGITGGPVASEWALQEIIREVRAAEDWVIATVESDSDVEARVGRFLGRLMSMDPREVLLVGHGASVHACLRVLLPGRIPQPSAGVLPQGGWNCALSTVDVAGAGEAALIRLFDTSHIPPRSVTSNDVYRIPSSSEPSCS